MLHSVIGVSDDIELGTALEEVIEECREKLDGHTPRVGILFSSCIDANFKDILFRIEKAFPGLQLIGCTTDGEITPQTSFIEDSLALLLLCSDDIEFGTAVATNLNSGPAASFSQAFAEAKTQLTAEPVCGFIFPDGLSTIGLELDKAIQESFGMTFPVFGGTAGDHFMMTGTQQFFGRNVYQDSAPILLLGGNVSLDVAVEMGPVPTGLVFPVGRCRKNIVYEIGQQSALAFYEEHLGEFNEHFTQFPLAVFSSTDKCLFMRSPVSADKVDGSVQFLGSFPEKCSVKLTMTSRSDLLLASEKAITDLQERSGGRQPDLMLAFPCSSFRHVLGSRTSELFKDLRTRHKSMPFFGFFCYGEIAPESIGTKNRFHSDTLVVVAIRSGQQ